MVQDVVQILSNLLANNRVRLSIRTPRLIHLTCMQDKVILEGVVQTFSRLVDALSSSPDCLQKIADHGLMTTVLPLFVESPPLLERKHLISVLKMLTKLCTSVPSLVEPLVTSGVATLLRCVIFRWDVNAYLI